jgi:hypothetical protein
VQVSWIFQTTSDEILNDWLAALLLRLKVDLIEFVNSVGEGEVALSVIHYVNFIIGTSIMYSDKPLLLHGDFC